MLLIPFCREKHALLTFWSQCYRYALKCTDKTCISTRKAEKHRGVLSQTKDALNLLLLLVAFQMHFVVVQDHCKNTIEWALWFLTTLLYTWLPIYWAAMPVFHKGLSYHWRSNFPSLLLKPGRTLHFYYLRFILLWYLNIPIMSEPPVLSSI